MDESEIESVDFCFAFVVFQFYKVWDNLLFTRLAREFLAIIVAVLGPSKRGTSGACRRDIRIL
ncbi:hypothetical protein [Thermococcus sp. 2319x1]|uniref:hypothetical protein n=1 Tax=Thermococcus sp. 2319x1 TaxID=1674923 RepID=UPI0015833478|nr:hypothetical protein [Thermococcus sp. 2319x1]